MRLLLAAAAPTLHDLRELMQQPLVQTLTGVLVLLLLAWLTRLLAHFVLYRVVGTLTRRTAWRWDDALFQHHVFRWLSRLAPALVVEWGARAIPHVPARVETVVANLALALVAYFVVRAICATLSALEWTYRQTPRGSERSIKGVVQLAKIIVFIIGILVTIAAITDKQVGLLLSGLGAMSAVLILVFKDTILGFVAGVQLATNDMLRVGDWITMSSAGADGDVTEITLYTVKVSNFDKTITTIPTWKLISESYQNWRGMKQTGGRRIKRALVLDATTAHFLDDEELARLSRFRLLGDYLSGKHDELAQWNRELGEAGEQLFNRRRLTNLGTFRAYVLAYLQQHPHTRDDMSCMARQLPAEGLGIPLELYCFTTTTVWAEYENIQGDIFDHLIALLPEFGLALYQQPTGQDMRYGLQAAGRKRTGSASGQAPIALSADEPDPPEAAASETGAAPDTRAAHAGDVRG